MDEVVKAARTSGEAFGQLFVYFYPPIFAYCSRRLLVRALAEDITSEVFLKAAVGITDFSGSCAEDCRELREAAVQMGAVEAAVSTSLFSNETPLTWEEVYQALCELPDREQSIISLRFFAGFKHEQIAAVLEIKTGTVRVALNRALNKLRDRLRTP